ncbi:MAG: NOL1/NOP2/SUN domain family protein [Thermoplasmatota archaeon]
MNVARIPAGPKLREWAQKNRVSDFLVARYARVVEESTGEHGIVVAALDGLVRRPPRYLRCNPLRATPQEVRQRLQARGFELAASDLDPCMFRVRLEPMSAGATVEHMQGLTTLQDLASAAAPLALAAKPGEVVADLAAAPGVKTIHIAGDMGRPEREAPPFGLRWLLEEGAIVAADPDEDRMRALRFNLERCGVSSALLRPQRAQDLPGEAWADRVLLDAPCTGEGTLPKDRSRGRERAEEVEACAAEQNELLDAADRILKPGGRLVYATCTFSPEENEGQVQRLLERGYRMETLPFDRVSGRALGSGITTWPGLTLSPEIQKARRFLPGIHPTLGFFVAALRKGAS